MPTIDFYLVSEPSMDKCYNFVCRLVDKGYQQQRSVYVHCNSSEEAHVLDDLLWIFRDDAFIPHNLYDASPVKIQIGHHSSAPVPLQDILINLTPEIPPFFNQFQRVLEVVPQAQKENSRSKYRDYRQYNCEVTSHDLTKSD